MKSRPVVSVVLLLGVGSSFSGCSDPPGIIPVAPPGVEFQRVPPPSAGSGSEAIGERAADTRSTVGAVLSTLVSEPTKPGETKKTASGLAYETMREGTGPAVKPGQSVKVNYVGRLADGTKFDASADHGGAFETKIGVGGVIKGWDEGIAGMKVGEKRRLAVPPELGYGPKGAGTTIPPNSTLVFEVELLEVK